MSLADLNRSSSLTKPRVYVSLELHRWEGHGEHDYWLRFHFRPPGNFRHAEDSDYLKPFVSRLKVKEGSSNADRVWQIEFPTRDIHNYTRFLVALVEELKGGISGAQVLVLGARNVKLTRMSSSITLQSGVKFPFPEVTTPVSLSPEELRKRFGKWDRHQTARELRSLPGKARPFAIAKHPLDIDYSRESDDHSHKGTDHVIESELGRYRYPLLAQRGECPH